MPGYGGRREGAGRPKGSVNKNTADIRELARQYGPAAIVKLAEMAGLVVDPKGKPVGQAKNEAVQQGCLKELMDRGYGRSRQPVSGPDESDDQAQPIQVVYRWAASDDSE